MLTRRDFLTIGGVSLLGACRPPRRREDPPAEARPATEPSGTQPATEPTWMQTRAIPKTGEEIPVIGLGTWQTFDVGAREDERAPLLEVLQEFFAAGGRVIDSSPMYGAAESVVGDLVKQAGLTGKMFLATKVWTSGRAEGEAQIERSMQRMGAARLDLLQIHNLLDWRTHLKTLRALKEEGRIRYIGITHYARSAFDEMEKIIRTEELDFVQLPYSIAVREAEKRLLPAAQERRLAVLVMRPFEGGSLFSKTRGHPLPDWASEFDCTSWAQFFLKWIVGHPVVTCPIPATSKPKHLRDNVAAGAGRLPTEEHRRRMVELIESL